ncbi:MAG: RNA polymerase sigma factor [Phaeodactylibacter sp.]|nr:RNA polymerase sigma factor [Phaeodactylibacter sp.]MCB9273359.1 RNA polymerase sigma factor [Lewinellaceae bacterium]
MQITSLKTEAGKSSAALSDETLIEMALRGNQQAYTLLAYRHESLLKAVIRRFFTDPNEVEETLQDTYIRAFQSMRNFRGDCKFSSWLYRIALSVSINRLKSNQRHALRVDSSIGPDNLNLGYAPDEMNKVEKEETRRWLLQAMSLLSGHDAWVLQLFYLEEQSIQEICKASGWTESNVKSKLSRARQRLRSIIEAQFSRHLMN